MVRATRTYARERAWLYGATRVREGANRKNEILCRQENDTDIAMLVARVGARMVVIGGTAIMMMVVVRAALIVIAAAELDIARERIGEMDVVMGVIDTVHQGDKGLPGQHHGQRHAHHGDGASRKIVSSMVQNHLAGGRMATPG